MELTGRTNTETIVLIMSLLVASKDLHEQEDGDVIFKRKMHWQ